MDIRKSPTAAMTNIDKDPLQKAQAINLSQHIYGTIAESGAGQETARWFFRAGGAAGTIAKTISAYDMTFSDAIYGSSPRYVSRERLHAMLDHEYQLILERLDAKRGAETLFFAFANTVAARSYSYKTDGHGWLGIRFQTRAREECSQIDLHVNLHGQKNLQDQETLGILGVNLIYAATHLYEDPEQLLLSLMDGLFNELCEIDMIDFSGPAFTRVDNRLMALRLVEKGLSNAAMFTPDGHIVQVAEQLWKKAAIIERSRFRPPTLFTINLLDCARESFLHDNQLQPDEVVELSEMTLKNLIDGEDIDVKDYLCRADLLCAMGKNVLISNYGEYYRLAHYLSRYTSKPVALAMGVMSVQELFNEKYYEHLPGGVLESFGRLFKNDLCLYVSPALDETGEQLITLDNLSLPENVKHLYQHLLENRYIRPLNSINRDYLCIYSHAVLNEIQHATSGWQAKVPQKVAELISDNHYFMDEVN